MNTTNQQSSTKRLEYIDALRGFIMLIIVYWHINYFSFDIFKSLNQINSFENIFLPFGMPLFFFISGLFAYKENQICNKRYIINVIFGKFKQLVIPTLLISGLYVYVFNMSFIGYLLSPMKYGFWFTISLFEYFVIYILISKILEKIKSRQSYDITLLILGLITFLSTIFSNKTLNLIGFNHSIPNALGFNNFQYFIYFILGIIAKRRFQIFESYLNNSKFIGLTIVLFFILSFIWIKEGAIFGVAINLLIIILLGISGSIVTFSFFYKYQDSFTKETKIGKVLQYIGKRTLDIYLLHYFFLPRNLKMVGEWFTENINPTLEFFVSLTLAAMVIALCLVVSNVIRISPFLANWLFGVKSK